MWGIDSVVSWQYTVVSWQMMMMMILGVAGGEWVWGIDSVVSWQMMMILGVAGGEWGWGIDSVVSWQYTVGECLHSFIQ